MQDLIVYDPATLNPIISDLNKQSANWESLLAELNAIVANLTAGFISETQIAFNAAHDYKRQNDYALMSQLLKQLPETIRKSMESMGETDVEVARRIRNQFGL
jgi:uncharacterized protein YukE